MKAAEAAQPGPLADLVRHIEATRPRHSPAQAADGTAATATQALEPGDLRYFRSTWSRLRVESQLAQSQAQMPGNAGPLHSDRLVLRALQALRELSPAYLNRYMAYIDALMALDQARAGLATAPVNPPHGVSDKQRKPGRGKPDKAAKVERAERAGPAGRAEQGE